MKGIMPVLLLSVLWALYYLIPIEYRLLWQPDETRYAEISRGLLASGDWVVPKFMGIRYFEKPIAGYWINNLGQMIFGHSNFAVRIGVVFSTTLTASLVAWLAYQMWHDKRTALLSAIIYLTCLLVYGVGSYAVLDPMFSLWLCLAMCSQWYAVQSVSASQKALGYVVLGIACGMGVLTKGFLALVLPLLGLLPWVVAEKGWREVLRFGPLAVLAAALIMLPWAIAIAQREPDFWHYFFWIEHIQRFADDDAQHKAPFWYYLPILLLGTLPWLGFLPGALRYGWQGRRQHPGTLFLLGWILLPLLFFSLAKGKLLTYLLPCYAPLAPLLARHALQAARQLSRAGQINGLINLLFGLAGLLIVLLMLAPLGFSSSPLYLPQEGGKIVAAALIFFAWGLLGYLASRKGGQRWWLAALCPLIMALLVGHSIPMQVVNAKQPQAVIEHARASLASSRYILSNSVGVASGIAWELQRDDIYLYDRPGEVYWGLQFADSRSRFVTRDAFADWLATHREQGAISLVLLLSPGETLAHFGLPPPDSVYWQGRFAIVAYLAR